MKIDILVSWRYSAASNSKRQVELRCNSVTQQDVTQQVIALTKKKKNRKK